MFLKAGAVSLGLLLASRLFGLLRESAQAAAFGATGAADVAVLMLTLPDWIAGVVASGALAYVLLPAWARQARPEVEAVQRNVMLVLLGLGLVLGLLLLVAHRQALALLAPGLSIFWRLVAGELLVWAALAIPLALLAALWATRLQHERDFAGMYGANLVVNGVLVAVLLWAGRVSSFYVLGMGLVAAMVLRLAWLQWRLRTANKEALDSRLRGNDEARPRASLWLWAALSAGLPLALPFVARSIASQHGEGALATFNYAWKLVELPLMLAVQLVATLAFPHIARAIASGGDAVRPVRTAMALAWTLAAAAAAGLLLAAPAIAQILFGWGRMQPESLAQVAQWGRAGAWGLLPQAAIAVGLTVLASIGRMRPAVIAYAAALGVLLATGVAGWSHGALVMVLMNVLFATVALVVLASMRMRLRDALPLRAMGVSTLLVGVCQVLHFAGVLRGVAPVFQVAAALAAAALVLGITARASPELRAALRR
ncbi:lipid II flippase MurJ [Ramlibacter sp.]|uniref:lipid II flippase MurJ n=1 Tax=Ramlibacter sp. TaxID=1917967 RepID=UPI003D151F32